MQMETIPFFPFSFAVKSFFALWSFCLHIIIPQDIFSPDVIKKKRNRKLGKYTESLIINHVYSTLFYIFSN